MKLMGWLVMCKEREGKRKGNGRQGWDWNIKEGMKRKEKKT